MRCVACKNLFPDELELVKPFLFLGRWQMLCAICAADHGGVQGINYRRAQLYLRDEKKIMTRLVMQSASLAGELQAKEYHK